MKNAFLLFLILILSMVTLYFSFLFISKDFTSKIETEPIVIKPIFIPSPVMISEDEKTFLKLKLALDDSIRNNGLKEEAEADEILSALKENLPPLEVLPMVVQQSNIIKKKIIEAKSVVQIKKLVQSKKVIKKELLEENKTVVVQKANTLNEILSSKRIPMVTENIQENISLGEQNDIHTLSQREQKNFNHLEVVSVSDSFLLEGKQDIKSPIKSNIIEQEVKFEDLSFVETLGVVGKSIPSTSRDE